LDACTRSVVALLLLLLVHVPVSCFVGTTNCLGRS
jgi:hypothetical protein